MGMDTTAHEWDMVLNEAKAWKRLSQERRMRMLEAAADEDGLAPRPLSLPQSKNK